MNVLVISTVDFNRHGIPISVMNTYSKFSHDSIQYTFVTNKSIDHNFAKIISQNHDEYYVLPDRKKQTLLYISKLFEVMGKKEYQIVHIHTNSRTCCIELLVAVFCRINTRIVHSHSASCEHRIIHKFLGGLFKLLYTHGVACSEEAGKHMFSHDSFTVINNGIDVELFKYNGEIRFLLRKELSIDDNALVIGHVGLFNEGKNQSFLVDVFYEFLKEVPNSYLVFIGSGPLECDVKEKVINLGIQKKILFLGEKSNTYDYYNVFDVFCFPSLYEGLGIVMIEAQANGLPCIASTGVPKKTDFSETTRYIELEVECWCDALLKVNNIDREKASRINKQHIIERGFSNVTTAKVINELYLKERGVLCGEKYQEK